MEQTATIIAIVGGVLLILGNLVACVYFFIRLGRMMERMDNLCTKDDAHNIAKFHADELRKDLDREKAAEDRGRQQVTPPIGIPQPRASGGGA